MYIPQFVQMRNPQQQFPLFCQLKALVALLLSVSNAALELSDSFLIESISPRDWVAPLLITWDVLLILDVRDSSSSSRASSSRCYKYNGVQINDVIIKSSNK